MFGPKISEFYHFQKYDLQNRGIYQGKDGEAALSPLWFNDHPEAAAENEELYTDFCCELAEKKIVPILLVPPYYLKGLSQVSLTALERRREAFYQVTGKADVRIFDFLDIFEDRREFFADLTHLNSNGAEAFTELINQTVLRETEESRLCDWAAAEPEAPA